MLTRSASTLKLEKSSIDTSSTYDIGKHGCKKSGEQGPERERGTTHTIKEFTPPFDWPIFEDIGVSALFQREVVHDLSFTLVAILERSVSKSIFLVHLRFLALKSLDLNPKKVLIIGKALDFRFQCSVVQVASLAKNGQEKEKCEEIGQ